MSARIADPTPIHSTPNEDWISHYRSKLAYEIDSWDLRNVDEDVVIIDARSNAAFEAEHIPGAINFPHRMITAETTAKFRHDRLYVTYCDGIGCNASTKGAYNLAKLGFRVKELIGGLDWWKRDGYDTTKATPSPASA